VALLVAERISKEFQGETVVTAVRGCSFSIEAGDFVAVMGPSGCGKSTLLHLCGAMERLTSGRLTFEGRSLGDLDEDALTLVRRQRVGMVFQSFNLLPTLTVLENVTLPLLLARTDEAPARERADALLARMGLMNRRRHYPSQLSGGEQQRAAIARAVVHAPALVIADEPTGNLDSDNGTRVLDLLVEINRESAVTVLLATHDPSIAAAGHRVLHMRDGTIERVDDRRTGHAPLPDSLLERATL
jgi:putative ABC transport system ATP-binding protein